MAFESLLNTAGDTDIDVAAGPSITGSPPDLVVIDDEVASDVIETVSLAVTRWPYVPVLLLVRGFDRRFVRNALEAGARGLIGKDCDAGQLLAGIQWMLRGEAILDPRVTTTVLAWAMVEAVASHDQLSDREAEVVRLVSDGESNKRIARQMGVSENTVKTYLRRACDKLGCRTRSAAAANAVRKGWI